MPSPTRRFMSINDAAEYLTISKRTMRNLIARGAVTAYRLPGSVRVVVDLGEIEDQMVPFRTADGVPFRAADGPDAA